MNNLLQLSGEVDTRDEDIRQLQNDLLCAQGDLEDARAELQKARRENAKAIAALRRQLSPLKQAIDMVFGEIEAIGGDDGAQVSGGNHKWDSIKSRLTPRLRETVDLLLIQGSMKRTQIAAALRMDYSNCTKNVIGVLMRQGLLVESGGNISLKQL